MKNFKPMHLAQSPAECRKLEEAMEVLDNQTSKYQTILPTEVFVYNSGVFRDSTNKKIISVSPVIGKLPSFEHFSSIKKGTPLEMSVEMCGQGDYLLKLENYTFGISSNPQVHVRLEKEVKGGSE